jgi:peroxiredoxin
MIKSLLLIITAGLLSFSPGYEVGDTASDFKLKNVDGKMISLADYTSAKGFIIAFDCNQCPVSKAYNERIQALHEKYAPLGYPLIAINPNSNPDKKEGESFEDMVKQANKKGYKFPYLYDEAQQTVKAFGATNTPHIFVLNKVGSEFKVAYIGAIDDNTRSASNAKARYVEEAVDALIAGKAVATPKTKAVGCGVKLRS